MLYCFYAVLGSTKQFPCTGTKEVHVKKLLPLLIAAAGLCACTARRSGTDTGTAAAADESTAVPVMAEATVPAAAEEPSVPDAAPSTKAEPAAVPAPRIQELNLDALRLKPSIYIAEANKLDGAHNVYDNSVLFPIGFSKDGKFACLSEVSLEGKGAVDPSFFIQDLVTDSIVCSIESPQPGSDDMDTAAFVQLMHEAIDAALAEFGIQQVPCTFLPFPCTGAGGTLDVRVEVSDTGKLLYDMFKIIDYTCIATDGSGRKKIITTKKDTALDDVYVCGYISNPFEDRIAVVLAEKAFGFEGCDLHYSVLGCSQSAGFSAK